MKKFILILVGISFILGTAIFILYKNKEESSEDIIEIFDDNKNEDIERKKEEETLEEIPTFIVDIKGMVNNPGVYEVEKGKRINDVINMAGGLTNDADTTNINLAKIVTDEMAIIIYSKEEVLEKYKQEVCICDCSYITNDACITESASALININTASKEELITIPGLGEAKALAIIDYRSKNGNFKSIEEVKEVAGIGEAIFEKIKNYITI